VPNIECISWERHLKEAWGQRESRKLSFSYHSQRLVSSHYVKMQKDDGIIGEEADLPAFLQHSKEDKANNFR